MYQDAGYGDNWEPEGNNARRFDPYTRSCTILASLFAIGFVLIVIIVLSLIPIYLSQKSTKAATNIQTTKIYIANYELQLRSAADSYDSQTVLSDANNRLALQAALTSMLQQDSATIGSIVDIDSSTSRSTRARRQTSNSSSLTFNLIVTSNKSCSATVCSHQYNSHVVNLLSDSTKTTSFVRYEQSNSTEIQWLIYRLPDTVTSNISLVFVDPKSIASQLNTLISIDQTQNQPTVENSTSNLVG